MSFQLSVMGRYFAFASLVAITMVQPLNADDRAEQELHPPESVLTVWRDLFARPFDGRLGQATNCTQTTDQSAVAALGQWLFQDTRLSGDGQRSCATCHIPARGFTDGLRKSRTPDGRQGPSNTPTLWNIGWAKALHWDGSFKELEAQAVQPIESASELAGSMADAIRKLNADPAIVEATREAFPQSSDLNGARILKSLAAYQRTLISPVTRFDSWAAGDDIMLDDQERAGFRLFVGRAGCARCHSGWRFTDDKTHDIGLATSRPRTAFKTPTLRELITTAPYMHDGSIPTLEQAVRHYVDGVVERSSLSPNLVRGLMLNEREISQLVAFLKTLSSSALPTD